MFNEIFKLIIGPVTGTALALIVNRLSEIRNKKAKLVFGIRCDNDITPGSEGIKTNPSGYQLYCVNIGQVAVFIESIVLYDKNYKNDYFFEIFPSPDNELSALMPFSPTTFSLDNQEYDNLVYFYNEKKKASCNVTAFSIDDKKYTGKANFWWIKTQYDSENSEDMELYNDI